MTRSDRSQPADAMIKCVLCREMVPIPSVYGRSPFKCASCGEAGVVLRTKIRAKNSQGSRRANSRDYSIRIKHGDTEQLIQFAGEYDSFELRQGDDAAFLYDKKDRLLAVTNLTIGTRMLVPRPSRILPYIIVFAAIVLTLAFLAVLGSMVSK